jgi:hypothetical protein
MGSLSSLRYVLLQSSSRPPIFLHLTVPSRRRLLPRVSKVVVSDAAQLLLVAYNKDTGDLTECALSLKSALSCIARSMSVPDLNIMSITKLVNEGTSKEEACTKVLSL